MRAALTVARWALPVGAVLLVLWLARRLDWDATAAALRGASAPLLLLAVAAELVSVAAKGLRWWLFLRPLGLADPGLAVRATFAGAAANNLVVANGGEAARVLLVTRAVRASKARVIATIALDRAWEAVGYGILLAAAAAVSPLPPVLDRYRTVTVAGLAALAAALVGLTRWERGHPAPLAVAPGGPLARVLAFPHRFAHSLAELSTPRRAAGAITLSVVVWATQLATYRYAAAAAHAPLPLAGDLLALLTVNLGFAVRVTPGGIGIFQALYVLAARSFGVPGPAAVAAAILIQLVQIIPITALGLAAAPDLIRRRPARPAGD